MLVELVLLTDIIARRHVATKFPQSGLLSIVYFCDDAPFELSNMCQEHKFDKRLVDDESCHLKISASAQMSLPLKETLL